jgi:GNAT superfamily N-acetyltransferase
MLESHRLTAERWVDFERLFESRGTLKGCWCMIFRASVHGEVPPPAGPARKRAMRELVVAGVPVGLLGYSDGVPVAWCSVAPRATFRGLAVIGAQSDPIWSITCFYVRREFRGTGATRQLLRAAIREARAGGAIALEAYPVEPDSPSYRFGGFKPLFEREGFREAGLLGSRRHVMRKTLGRVRGASR